MVPRRPEDPSARGGERFIIGPPGEHSVPPPPKEKWRTPLVWADGVPPTAGRSSADVNVMDRRGSTGCHRRIEAGYRFLYGLVAMPAGSTLAVAWTEGRHQNFPRQPRPTRLACHLKAAGGDGRGLLG